MKVQDTSLTGTSARAAPPAGGVARPAGADDTPAGKLSSGDRVEWSGFAGKLGATLAAQSAGRASRVAALTRDYQAGRYQPDAQATSHAMVAEMLDVTAGQKGA